MSNIRQTDAIVHVVRCFEDEEVIHVAGKIDPLQDIETINLELILADMQNAENIKSKIEKKARVAKEFKIELDTIEKIIDHLNQNIPLRLVSFTQEEQPAMSQWSFLTSKKVIYIANIKETDLNSIDENPYIKTVKEFSQKENS